MRKNIPISLRGMSFKGEILTFEDPTLLAYRRPKVERTCNNCSFWRGDDCSTPGDEAKQKFDVSADEKMPTKIDDLEVGWYCPCWTRGDLYAKQYSTWRE